MQKSQIIALYQENTEESLLKLNSILEALSADELSNLLQQPDEDLIRCVFPFKPNQTFNALLHSEPTESQLKAIASYLITDMARLSIGTVVDSCKHILEHGGKFQLLPALTNQLLTRHSECLKEGVGAERAGN